MDIVRLLPYPVCGGPNILLCKGPRVMAPLDHLLLFLSRGLLGSVTVGLTVCIISFLLWVLEVW